MMVVFINSLLYNFAQFRKVVVRLHEHLLNQFQERIFMENVGAVKELCKLTVRIT